MGWVGLDLYVCGLGWVVGYENGPMDNSDPATATLTQSCDEIDAFVFVLVPERTSALR